MATVLEMDKVTQVQIQNEGVCFSLAFNPSILSAAMSI